MQLRQLITGLNLVIDHCVSMTVSTANYLIFPNSQSYLHIILISSLAFGHTLLVKNSLNFSSAVVFCKLFSFQCSCGIAQ